MKHRLLVVGLGSIGERHARCALATGRAEVIGCEPNDALRQRVCEQYHITESFANLDAALSASPTAAVICAPAHLHIPIASQLARAKLNLLIEKPLSTTLEGIEALKLVIDEHRLAVAVAYVQRLNPNLSAMQKALQSGQFGKIYELVAVAGQHFPFYRPAYRDTYYNSHATGGGAVQDALSHLINAGEWLLGKTDRVVADVAHVAIPHVSVEDTAHVLARHQGVPATYSLNQHQMPNEFTITIACERATVRCELHQNRWGSTLR